MHNVNNNLNENAMYNNTIKNLGYVSGLEYTINTDGTTGLKVDVQAIDEKLQEWADDIVYKPIYRFTPAYDRGRWMPTIRKVIFNDPATIVLWGDGTKTVVKAHNEKYDPEKGLAMAIAEKYYGTYSAFKKDIPTENLEKRD